MIDICFMDIVNIIKYIYHYRHQHHDLLTSRTCKNFHYRVLSVLRPSKEYYRPLTPVKISITAFFTSFGPLMSKVSEGDCCNFI